ncbi:MAG: hypothetical protein QF464_24355, partial [Myxococcota bacterium]|nr:hypothetical protein [Myxococcota bacterium]
WRALGALNRKEYRRCYELALKSNPQIEGRLAIDVGWDDMGGIVAAKVTSNTTEDAKIATCIEETLLRLHRLPRQAASADFALSFTRH